MKKLLLCLVLFCTLSFPASATTIEAPEPPKKVESMLSGEPENFSDGLQYVIGVALEKLAPNLAECVRICLSLLATILILSLLKTYQGKSKALVDLGGVIAVGCLLLENTHSLVRLGTETVTELSEYGKLLIPVMTTALAAQGGSASAAALYAATAFFNSLLTGVITHILVPGIYIYLALSVMNAAIGDALMKKLRDFIKWILSWGLKVILYAFTGYVTITGVVSGTTDQMALKAAKAAFGGMIPVVGGILSDASETILVSVAVMKNSVGIYGMLVLIAILIGPLLKIGAQYLTLKLTTAVCGIFSDKTMTELVDDFSTAMGFLLAMTGTTCVLLLISVVCFLRGMG